MVWRKTSDTWTKAAPLFTAPVSSVPDHFSTSPSSLTEPPHQPPSLTATYITLTNHRPQGFLPHIYHWHLLLKSVSLFSGGDSYSIIAAVSRCIHLLFIYIIYLFILYISESISLHSNTITIHSGSFFPPPLLCLPLSLVWAEHIGMLHLSGASCMCACARNGVY